MKIEGLKRALRERRTEWRHQLIEIEAMSEAQRGRPSIRDLGVKCLAKIEEDDWMLYHLVILDEPEPATQPEPAESDAVWAKLEALSLERESLVCDRACFDECREECDKSGRLLLALADILLAQHKEVKP